MWLLYWRVQIQSTSFTATHIYIASTGLYVIYPKKLVRVCATKQQQGNTKSISTPEGSNSEIRFAFFILLAQLLSLESAFCMLLLNLCAFFSPSNFTVLFLPLSFHSRPSPLFKVNFSICPIASLLGILHFFLTLLKVLLK